MRRSLTRCGAICRTIRRATRIGFRSAVIEPPATEVAASAWARWLAAAQLHGRSLRYASAALKNDKEVEEFEISGSTYEPIGDLFSDGKKAKGADWLALEEISTISVMCNDSAIDFNEYKNAFEKVGEATETALIVLAEKLNPYDLSKSGGRLESAKVVRKDMETKWKKDFTLEFSRYVK